MIKKDTKLYNVIFPFWMLMLFPQMWLIILPANFIVDSLVLLVSMLILKIQNKKQWYKKHILKIFGFGMLSDIIGGAYMMIFVLLGISSTCEEFYLTLPAFVISTVLIYVFNYFITFRKVESELRLKLSLIFALVTAPYTFFIPASWMY